MTDARAILKDDRVKRLVEVSRAVIDSISFDDNGALIGGKWMGGHGGLLSDDTRKKAGELRRVLSSFEEPRP